MSKAQHTPRSQSARMMVRAKDQEIVIGKFRQLANGKWVWNSFGRSARKQHDSLRECYFAAQCALGNEIYVNVDDTIEMNRGEQ